MPDDTTGITIRTATEDTFGAFVKPLPVAFGETWSDAEIETERKVVEYDRVIGAFEGDTPVGVSGAYTFRLTTPGGEIGAAGITLVGVLPSHRRRGILRLMMTDLFEQARDRGESVAVLWASEAAIYQKFGYGQATQAVWFDAVKDKIRFRSPVGPIGRVRIVDREEASALFAPIYDARRAVVPGSLDRKHAKWLHQIANDADWMHGTNGPKVLALLEIDGEPRAYVIYRTWAEWDNVGPNHRVTVMELIGLDPMAEQALWEWVFSLDLVGTVRAWRGPAPHPVAMSITEPRRLKATVNDGIWLRIIDLPAALAGRRYHGPGSMVLDVTDEFCPSNAGRWQLTIPSDDAVGTATPAGEGAPVDLALDISALAATYLGAFRFGDMARAGRIRECRPGAIAAADAMFATSVAPFCSTMF